MTGLAPAAPDAGENRMSTGQSRALHAALRSEGATGDGRFPVLAAILGREVTSTHQITAAEATAILRELNTRGLSDDDAF